VTDDELAHRRDVAGRIAEEAASLAARLRAGGMGAATMKGAQDFLTEADGATERFIRDRLAAAFPGEPVLGEEGGGETPEAGPLWILDPIDGTSNFARGGDRWCVSIGMALDGTAVLGAVARHAPAELVTGARGLGAALNGRPIHAAGTAEFVRATIELGWSLRRPVEAYVALVGRVMALGAGMRCGGSGTLGLVETAIGRLDGYLELHINAWDAAAALAIAREAGCWTSAFDSGAWLTAGNPICFAAPALGPRLAALMKA
jgi:myo-inositol-1(or 4)-monophosphatase